MTPELARDLHDEEPLSESEWLPLVDFAALNGVSVSTLRRHIKAQKIPFKLENRRYYVPQNFAIQTYKQALDHPLLFAQKREMHRLSEGLKRAQEEIAELKTLIAFYEETLDLQK